MPWPTKRRSRPSTAVLVAVSAGTEGGVGGGETVGERPRTSSFFRRRGSDHASSLPRPRSSPCRVAGGLDARDDGTDHGGASGGRTRRSRARGNRRGVGLAAALDGADADDDVFFDASVDGEGQVRVDEEERREPETPASTDSSSLPLPLAPFPYEAHRAAFEGDVESCVRHVLSLGDTERLRLSVDPRGATVLHVAAAAGREDVVRALLGPPLSLPPAPLNDPTAAATREREPEPFSSPTTTAPTAPTKRPPKNKTRWTPLDEAAAAGHRSTARVLAEATAAAAKLARAESRRRLAEELESAPDFRFVLKWELTTSLPLAGHLLRKVAPRDEYTVWKRGSSVRVDGSLRGLEEGGGGGVDFGGGRGGGLLPEWRRGPFSVVWRAGRGGGGEAGEEEGGPPAAPPRVVEGSLRRVRAGSGGGGAPSEAFASADSEADDAAARRPPPSAPLWALIDRERNSWIDLTAERRSRGDGGASSASASPAAAAVSKLLADAGVKSKISLSSPPDGAAETTCLRPCRGSWLGRVFGSSSSSSSAAYERVNGWRALPFDASVSLTAVTARRAPVRFERLGGDCSPTKRMTKNSKETPTKNARETPTTSAPSMSKNVDGDKDNPSPSSSPDSPRVLTYEDWLSAPPNEDSVEAVPVDPLGAAGVPGRGASSHGGEPPSSTPSAPALCARAWLTPDCPVPASTVLSLLDLAGGAAPPLAAAGKIARRLFRGGADGGAGGGGMMPIKLSVPLLWTLRVKVGVHEFSLLDGGERDGVEVGEKEKGVGERGDPGSLAASLARDPQAFFDLPEGCRLKTVRGLRESRSERRREAAAAAASAARAAGARGGATSRDGGQLQSQASRASDGFPMSPLRDGFDDLDFS